jgi:hypothetical protein
MKGTGSGQCTSTAYCEALFVLVEKDGIPASEITGVTATDLANGVLASGGYTVVVNAGQTIAAGASATALQSFINAGGTYVGDVAAGATSARNAGVTTLNTNTIAGISTPGSTFDATWNTADPEAWGFDAGGWVYRESSNDPNFDPATLAGGGSVPAAVTVAKYAPAGDCGGPAGFGNCYGYEINANANLPGRPAVVDQPFGSGHAIMLGFDPFYRAWNTEEERLVLNAVLFPSGTPVPMGTTAVEAEQALAHAAAPVASIASASLPRVARRPVRPSGGSEKDVVLGVARSDAARLRRAVKAAGLSRRYTKHASFVRRDRMYEYVMRGVRTGDVEDRSGWESQLLGTISAHKISLKLGQI